MMVAAAKMQPTRDCAYIEMVRELDSVSTLRRMEKFHTESIIEIKKRLAEIDPARHPLAGRPPFSDRIRRRRDWEEGVAICCLTFSVGLIFLAATAHIGRMFWDLLSP